MKRSRPARIRIAELVLHGGHGVDRERLVEALRVELCGLLDTAPPAGHPGRVQIDGHTITLDPGRGSAAIGRQIAHGIHGALPRPAITDGPATVGQDSPPALPPPRKGDS